MSLFPGARLGPYEILSALGAGGMGEVWKAHDTRLDRFVAIKRLIAHNERFGLEARAIAALNHPHICQIHDVGPDYLVLEYIDGVPLGGPLAADEAVRLALQMASALEEAHGKGMLHRDLKPANVLVTPSGMAKLLDFGLAKLVTADGDVTRTMDGVVVGTAAYMSPEQATGRPLDARSDIFSFGAVLHEMLAGTRAFAGRSAAEVMSAILRDEPAPLAAPPALERIVTRCLRKEPAQRFQTMTDVKTALGGVLTKPDDQQPSIAVLPFANMSGDKENEYFSDGLAEEILNALAQIPGLKVTARTSAFAFRGKEQDITKIAEALRVRTVLEGSVRRSGNRVRVSAQLINAADGYHLWSDRYDRELTDAFAIQDEIAQAIVGTLRGRLAPDVQPAPRYKPNPAAYEAFLKARYWVSQFGQDAAARARVLVDQSIAIDPGFALARQLRSRYYLRQALWEAKPAHEMMPLVRVSALEALAYDASLPEGHAYLGIVAGLYAYDWAEQDRQFRLALARDPVSPDVLANYGIMCLLVTRRPEDAVKALKQALEEDPLNQLIRVQLGICLDAAGEVGSAEGELQQVLELSDFAPATEWLALHCAFRGKLQEAADYAERTFAAAGQHTRFAGLLAGILQRAGDTARASRLLATLGAGDAPGVPIERIFFSLLQSDLDEAANWAEKAIEQRDPYFPVLLGTVVGTPLRSSTHWPRLAAMMNLEHLKP